MPEELSSEEARRGIQIARVWMLVAGSARAVPQCIMPDPDDPERRVVCARDRETKQFAPVLREGEKQVVVPGADGMWRLADGRTAQPAPGGVNLLPVNQQLKAFYEATGDLKEARSQAENFLNRRLAGLYPQLDAEALSGLRQWALLEMDRIERNTLRVQGRPTGDADGLAPDESERSRGEPPAREPPRELEDQPVSELPPEKRSAMGDILSQDEVDAILASEDDFDRLMKSPAYATLAEAVFPEDPPKKEMGSLLVSLDGLVGQELPEEQLEKDLERRLKQLRKYLSDLGVSDARLLELPGAVRQALSERRTELPKKAAPGSSAIVTSYDFKHPARVNKDQLRTLENLHDNFARLLSSTFSGAMRAVVDVDTAFVDQTTYAEFIMSLSNPSCSYQFTLGPTNGQAIIDFAMPVVFAFVDRIFGGKGSSQGVDARQMTPIEMGVIAKIVKRVIEDLEATWEPILRVEISDIELETNPEFMQITAASEIVILLAFEVNSTNASGLVSLCYPFYTLESLLPRLGQQGYVRSRREDRQQILRRNRAILGPARVPLVAELGRADLAAAEVAGIKVGDVICSTSRRSDPALVFAGGQPKYYARPFAEGDGPICMEIAGRVPRELQPYYPLHDRRTDE